MGKFDGYLICSDLDGTFSGGGDTVKVNGEAVKYFTENGGKFTFATGRTVSHLRNPEFFDIINAPACLCNGGILYDYQNETVLFEERLPFTLGEFLNEISDFGETITKMNLFQSCVEDSILICDRKEISQEMLQWKLIKIVCAFETAENADKFKEQAKKRTLFHRAGIMKSWPVGVEFNSALATKGEALEFLKQHLGTIYTTVGIGDYENDIPLLQHADIGAAPENAIDSVKAVAKMVVKRADEYAIKDLIEQLEKRIEQHK